MFILLEMDVLETDDAQGAEKINDAEDERFDEHGNRVVAVVATSLAEIPFDEMAEPSFHPANLADDFAENLLGKKSSDADHAGSDEHRDADGGDKNHVHRAYEKRHGDELDGVQAPIDVGSFSGQNFAVRVDDPDLPAPPVDVGAFWNFLAPYFRITASSCG